MPKDKSDRSFAIRIAEDAGSPTLANAEMRRLKELAERLDQHNAFAKGQFVDHHVFVHAGVRPHEPLEEQLLRPSKPVLLWIRDLFLDEQRDFGRYVVHGRTVTRLATPDIRENRCNLDTGAGHGRRLSAAVFDLSQRHPIHTFSI